MITACLAVVATLFPEGAPWNVLDDPSGEACAQCHFGDAEIRGSEALSVDIPAAWTPPHAVPVTVRLIADAPRAGFMLVARTPDGGAASGRFVPVDDRAFVSPDGSAARQTDVGSERDEDAASVSWALLWYPDEEAQNVTFHAAAVAGNDDDSPFGDTVHRQRTTLCTGC